MRLFVLTENVCGNVYCLILIILYCNNTNTVLRYSPFDIQPSVYGEGYESNSTQCKNLLTADCVLERLSLSLSIHPPPYLNITSKSQPCFTHNTP